MATTIGNLVVKLTAVTAPFTRGMSSASSSVTRLAAGVATAAKSVATIGTAMGAVAAGGMALMVKQQMSAIDATAKLSDRLGISTEKLVGLQHAANLSGTSTDTMSMALQRMTRRVSEAARGSGEAVGAIKELGIDARALAAMTPDQQLYTFADALQGVATQGDRVRIAMKLFDSEGVQLLNMLQGGSAGLAKMQAEAQKLGLTFNRIDAAKVEAANDAMTRLGAVFTGVGRTLAIELAPFIEAATTKLVEMGTSGEGMGAKVVGAVQWVTEGLGSMADVVAVVAGAGQKMFALFVNGLTRIQDYIALLARAYDSFVNTVMGGNSNLEGQIKKHAKEMRRWSMDVEMSADKLLKSGWSGENAKKVTAFFDDIRTKAQAAAEATTGIRTPLIETDSTPAAKAEAAEASLPQLLIAGTAEAINFINQQRLGGPGRGIDGLNKIAQQQLDEAKRQTRAIEGLAGGDDDGPVVAF